MSDPTRRTGAETRAEIQRVAVALFSSQGYEATSMRQIADELGIRKASLYYHFASKEEIVRAGVAGRGDEAAALLEWARSQPAAPDLLERAVLRWVGTYSVEKLRGIRFVNANPALLRTLATGAIGDNLEGVVSVVAAGESDPRRLLMIRMAFLSINAAAAAANGSGASDEDVVAAARETSLAILERLAIP
jgi:AcrR family transcriptional regulator